MRLSERQKELQDQLKELIKKFGYWSNEVQEFNDSLSFNDMNGINLNIKK